MMNKRSANVITAVLLMVVVVTGTLIMAHTAFAQTNSAIGGSVGSTIFSITKLFGLNMGDAIAELLAWIMNWAVMAMSFGLALAGYLLNFSINLTLHIKDFVNSSPAVYNTWRAIRDISGLFIIFFLLYAAIQLILGLEDPKFGALIKNIVMAGILINFSFFFAGLGIDASNIISVQLYNAIAPSNQFNAGTTQFFNAQSNGTILKNLDGGLSDIFMTSLRIPSLYDPNAGGLSQTAATLNNSGSGASAIFTIFFDEIAAFMIELVAAISFALAAFAFIVRFVLLIVLLAFSPIWFVSFISPRVAEKAKKWWDTYLGMLLFMPVYLLLMYFALNVLTTSPLFGSLNGNAAAGSIAGSVGNGAWYSGLLVLGINAAIVIFLLNLPLITAISIAGGALSFVKAEKFGAGAMWQKFGSQAGSRIFGRMAYSAGQSEAFKKLASTTPILGSAASAGLSKISAAGFGGGKKGGYEERLKAKKKAEEAMHKRLGTVERGDYATKEAYDEAVKRAKEYQASYRENLPWSNKLYTPSGIVGFVVDNRANRQTSAKLMEEVRKKQNAKDLKTNKRDRDSKETELKEIKEKIKNQERGVGFQPGKPASSEDLKHIEELEKEIKDLEAKIDEGEQQKEEDDADKIANKVSEKSKSDSKSDEKKEEKK